MYKINRMATSHRKVIRDSLQGITRRALQRLTWRAGIRRTSKYIYEELRGTLRVWLEIWISDSIIVGINERRQKTIKEEHVALALEFGGLEFAAGLSGKLLRGQAAKKKGSKGESRHRFRSGTVALRQISREQRQSDKSAIPYVSFSRLVREIAQDYEVDNSIRFTRIAISFLQIAAETQLVKLLEHTQLAALHAGRLGVSAKDFTLVRRIYRQEDQTVLAPIYHLPGLNYLSYIYKLLKRVRPNTGINKDARLTLNNLIISVVGRMMQIINTLLAFTGKKIITSRQIQSAARILLPGELYGHAAQFGVEAVVTFQASTTSDGKKHARQIRAGIVFPVARTSRLMKAYSNSKRLAASASVYMAAILEYIAADILSPAGNYAQQVKLVRIKPRQIMLAIRNSENLDALFSYKDYIVGAGVPMRINPKVAKKAKFSKEEGEETETS